MSAGSGRPASPGKLRKRREFLACARGLFRAMPLIVVQMRRRGDDGPARIGFTTTRRIGNAVVRNRARRRMREVVRQLPSGSLRNGHDYVFIARDETASADFAQLRRQTARAVKKLNAGEGHPGRPRGGRRAGNGSK